MMKFVKEFIELNIFETRIIVLTKQKNQDKKSKYKFFLRKKVTFGKN